MQIQKFAFQGYSLSPNKIKSLTIRDVQHDTLYEFFLHNLHQHLQLHGVLAWAGVKVTGESLQDKNDGRSASDIQLQLFELLPPKKAKTKNGTRLFATQSCKWGSAASGRFKGS